jgi:dihydroneopterin aldolase
MTFLTATTRIVLHKLEFLVFLGWGAIERSQPQTISVDIHIHFAKPPAACLTDDLADTFCYDTLNKTLKNHLSAKEFRLLEHLAYEIYSCVKAFITPENKINLCVTKHPDVFFKSGGVSFWFGDDHRENQ